MNAERLAGLAATWRRLFLVRDALLIAGAVAVGGGIGALWLSPERLALVIAIASAIGFLARALVRPSALTAATLARHLDRTFPALEESSTLWLRVPETLTTLEQLQRARIDAAAERLEATRGAAFAAPDRAILRQAALFALGGVFVFAASLAWSVARQSPHARAADAPPQVSATPNVALPNHTPIWLKIISAELLVRPPAYTGRAERRIDGFDAEIEEGATVTWKVALDQPVQEARLTFSAGGEVLPLDSGENLAFVASRALTETTLYQLEASLTDGSAWNPADIHSLKVIKDRAPSLKVAQPVAVRTELSPAAEVRVAVEVLATDDYGIADAHLVATVAKGTGEGVKFREEKIAFDAAAAAENGSRRFTKTLELVALGLEPGDELYFYVEAADNRQPTSNRARSETRFVVLKGPEQSLSTPAAGVAGVNLVPEYFRSQRQIIIDTERLIAERPTLPATEFGQRANSLGIDQQLLRQRYGQFLGEEAEGNAPQEDHFPGDGHDHGSGVPQTQAEVAERFGHTHDSQDQATLRDRATKGTMRQALAAMWEGERFLRMAQPEEALAPENRALEILKELQQADRAYVQRVGFEATPLDVPGRRLRGDVTSVPERAVLKVPSPLSNEEFEAVRTLLRLAPWSATARALTAPELEALERAEPPMVRAATGEPEKFLAGLEELRRVRSSGAMRGSSGSQLEAALLRMLPPVQPLPARAQEVSPLLAAPYFGGIKEATER